MPLLSIVVKEDRQRGREEGERCKKYIRTQHRDDATRRLIADPAREHRPPVHRAVRWHQSHYQTAATLVQPAAQATGSSGAGGDTIAVGRGQGKAVVVASARAQNASETGAQTQVVRVWRTPALARGMGSGAQRRETTARSCRDGTGAFARALRSGIATQWNSSSRSTARTEEMTRTCSAARTTSRP